MRRGRGGNVTEFIRREFLVEDPDKTTVIKQDAPAQRPGPAEGVLFVIGLSGSGKSEIARRVAEALGRQAAELPLDGADAALDDLFAAAQNGSPAVVAVPHKLLAGEGLRKRLQAGGRVLYLMAGAETIAARQAKTPEEEATLRERLGRQRTAFEPYFMQTLHLLAPADGPLDQVLADVLERVRL
jgi:shikimate kinase